MSTRGSFNLRSRVCRFSNSHPTIPFESSVEEKWLKLMKHLGIQSSLFFFNQKNYESYLCKIIKAVWRSPSTPEKLKCAWIVRDCNKWVSFLLFSTSVAQWPSETQTRTVLMKDILGAWVFLPLKVMGFCQLHWRLFFGSGWIFFSFFYISKVE